jgi:hypothetical protein
MGYRIMQVAMRYSLLGVLFCMLKCYFCHRIPYFGGGDAIPPVASVGRPAQEGESRLMKVRKISW